jgi:capsular polysaccharide biosynthesis protein
VLRAPAPESIIELLQAWRFWFVSAAIGALLAGALYLMLPGRYRATATVNVDFHLEQAWPQNTDREQFYYLEREARKLEEIAKSDAVLTSVASQFPGTTVQQLRGTLVLSQPGNGGWHFHADDTDPGRAASLASAWAHAFAHQVDVMTGEADGGALEKYITAEVTQSAPLATQRVPLLGYQILIGAIIAMALAAFGMLFLDSRR